MRSVSVSILRKTFLRGHNNCNDNSFCIGSPTHLSRDNVFSIILWIAPREQARWSESCVQLLTRLVNCCAISTRNMTKLYGAFSSTVFIGFLTAWQKGSTSYGLYGRKCRWKSVRTLHVSLYSVVRFSTYLRFSYTGSHYCISEFREKWKKCCLLCLPGYYANAFRTSTNEAQVINKCTCWNGLAIAVRCLIQNDMLVNCDCILHGDAVFSQIICAPPLWSVVSLIK